MRTTLYTLALCISLLLACKGQPHATPSSAPPAQAAPAATPIGVDADASPSTAAKGNDLSQQGQPCPDGTCAEGLRCLSYYGIAGANGPQFATCELPCAANSNACPSDQQCVVIADGPGQVCKPR